MLSAKVRAKILEALGRGRYAVTACALAGVDPSNFYRALARAEEPGASRALREFRAAVESAKAKAEDRLLSEIEDSCRADGTADWTARAWILERTRPERYGRIDRSKIELAAKVATAPSVDPRRLSTEELVQLDALLSKAAPEQQQPTTEEPNDGRDRGDG